MKIKNSAYPLMLLVVFLLTLTSCLAQDKKTSSKKTVGSSKVQAPSTAMNSTDTSSVPLAAQSSKKKLSCCKAPSRFGLLRSLSKEKTNATKNKGR